MSDAMAGLEARFETACSLLLGALAAGEEMSLEFSAEAGEFMRFTKGKVRQVGAVTQSSVRFSYYHDGRTMGSSFEMTGVESVDRERAAAALQTARADARLLPPDPWQVLPSAAETSREVFAGRLPEPSRLPDEVLPRWWRARVPSSWESTRRAPCAGEPHTAGAPGTGSPRRRSSPTIRRGSPTARR